MENEEHGLIDNWLRHIKDASRFNAGKLNRLRQDKKLYLLCELNVIEQVTNVCNSTIVQNAWKNGVELSVHGWVYGIEDGILKDLGTSFASNEQLAEMNRNVPADILTVSLKSTLMPRALYTSLKSNKLKVKKSINEKSYQL